MESWPSASKRLFNQGLCRLSGTSKLISGRELQFFIIQGEESGFFDALLDDLCIINTPKSYPSTVFPKKGKKFLNTNAMLNESVRAFRFPIIVFTILISGESQSHYVINVIIILVIKIKYI